MFVFLMLYFTLFCVCIGFDASFIQAHLVTCLILVAMVAVPVLGLIYLIILCCERLLSGETVHGK